MTLTLRHSAPEQCLRFVEFSGDARRFELMTFRPFRRLLATIAPPLKAFVAYDGETACGFVLGALDPEGGPARLLSVFVRHSHRRQGVGRELLRCLREAWPGRPLFTRWSSALPQVGALESLLAASGWSKPELTMLQCETTPVQVAAFAGGRTLGRGRGKVAGFSWSLWSERTAEDDAAIGALIARPGFPARLDPYRASERIVIWPANSMILRRAGTPVGWGIAAHEDDLVIYDCMYVRPELERLGAVIVMLVEMFRLQGEHLGAQSRARYFVSPKTPAMMAISRGGLRAALTGYSEHYCAWSGPQDEAPGEMEWPTR